MHVLRRRLGLGATCIKRFDATMCQPNFRSTKYNVYDVPSSSLSAQYLTYVIGDEFRKLVEPYLYSGLRKGIPSLFADIKALYSDTLQVTSITAKPP